MRSSKMALWEVLLLLCLTHQSCVLGVASALPLGEWADSVEKASSHRHWEHMVKRSSFYARYNSDNYEDDTAHIVNVQEYYRDVFAEGWDSYKDNEKELFNMLTTLESVVAQGYGRENLEDKVALSQNLKDTIQFGTHTKQIRGRYIVMLQDDADDYTLDRTMAVLSKANHESNRKIRASDMHALRYAGKGFTATLNSKAVELMAKHPSLAHIEEDTALRRSDVMIHEDDEAVASKAVPWNLDRLDQRTRALDQSFDPSGDGSNVDIYIIDTGVRGTHEDLKGRVKYAGFDAVDELTGTHDHGEDLNGHGTHCAGTAAGTTYGVAKKATIYNLRALNAEGTGAVSGIVMGIDRIIRYKKEGRSGRPIVISQSLGVKKSPSLNEAIKEATEVGIVAVGATGNQGSYSCDYSPASAPMGISVGASDQRDEVAIFSNFGECTSIIAPGSQITSASHKCDTCTKTMSGTSMSAPHVAGYAAIIMGQHPHMTAEEVKAKMISQSTKDIVRMASTASSSSHKTPNRLLYVESAAAAREASEAFASIQSIHGRP